MGYSLKPEFWLKTETDRVEGLATMRANWSTTWTPASLQLYLQGQDLTYTVVQCAEILDELKRRGVLVEN